jgi:hypothetical protein
MENNKQSNKQNKWPKKYEKKRLNDNCFVLAPNGQLLHRAPLSRLNWYVNKGLANFEAPILDNGVSCECIKLNFEPFHVDLEDYYINFKENCCVVCGQTENLTSHSIIPSEYKKALPFFLKTRVSHDILLFCLNCNDKLLNANQEFSNDLAVKFNCPVKYASSKYEIDYSIKKVKKACYMYKNGKLQESEHEEYCNIIKDYFKVDDITDEIIFKSKQLNKYSEVEGYKFHGEIILEGIINDYKEAQRKGEEPEFKKWIVDYHSSWELFKEYKLDKDLVEIKGVKDENMETFNIFYPFILMWRMRFLGIMQPKYLPKYWSVYSRINRINHK